MYVYLCSLEIHNLTGRVQPAELKRSQHSFQHLLTQKINAPHFYIRYKIQNLNLCYPRQNQFIK